MATGKNLYPGINNEPNGGMSRMGNIIRDAWVFELIPESQTCERWGMGQLDALYEQVSQAWMPYGHLASSLPPELRERHGRIYAQAITQAKNGGWDPDAALENDD